MRNVITTLGELLGAGLAVAGIALVSVPLAFIVAGVALVALSYRLDRPPPAPPA